MANVELSESDEVIVHVPWAIVKDHRPEGGVVPVTTTLTSEFGWIYWSVMTQVFPPDPHVPVLMTLRARGGSVDWGLWC